MKDPGLTRRGNELIENLKQHILTVLRSRQDGESGVSFQDLQRLSGLSIVGKTGQEVWLMAFYTLLIELLKEQKINSEVTSLNTNEWKPTTLVRLRRL
jgi:hypothetical protein